jgi:hypothetical protein
MPDLLFRQIFVYPSEKVAMPKLAPVHRSPILIAMFCTALAIPSATAPSRTAATAAAPTVQPGTFKGSAFDTCTAPSGASMAAWLASPYRAVGVYFGGDNRACTQADLTAGWVSIQVAAGWHLIPLYVGPQASCTLATRKKKRIHNARAAAQGAAAARDAAARARALGLAAQSVLVYDMEAYRTGDAACRAGVLGFMGAWTARLHDLGYLSGFYSSMGSGVADQVANYAAPGYVRPDYLDFARWDRAATITDAAIPAGHWWPHRRMKQHTGDHTETWGGVTINIDSNTVDFAPLPAARSDDLNRNGRSDGSTAAYAWRVATVAARRCCDPARQRRRKFPRSRAHSPGVSRCASWPAPAMTACSTSGRSSTMRDTSAAVVVPFSPRTSRVGAVTRAHCAHCGDSATGSMAARITSGSKRGHSPSGRSSRSSTQDCAIGVEPRKSAAARASRNGTGHEANQAPSLAG